MLRLPGAAAALLRSLHALLPRHAYHAASPRGGELLQPMCQSARPTDTATLCPRAAQARKAIGALFYATRNDTTLNACTGR